VQDPDIRSIAIHIPQGNSFLQTAIREPPASRRAASVSHGRPGTGTMDSRITKGGADARTTAKGSI